MLGTVTPPRMHRSLHAILATPKPRFSLGPTSSQQTSEVQTITFVSLMKKLSLKDVRGFAQGHTNSLRKSQSHLTLGTDSFTLSSPVWRVLFTWPEWALTTLKFSKLVQKLQASTLKMAMENGRAKWIIQKEVSKKGHIEKWAINLLTWCFLIFKASLKKPGT